MNTYSQYDEVKRFLKQVCGHIKAKEVHQQVSMELVSHLQELIDEKISSGIDPDSAVREQFHQAHLPRVDWRLLTLIALFMMFGLVAVFAAQTALSNRIGLSSIGMKQVVYFCVGGCLMLLIGFSNYSKLARYSWVIYIGTILLIIYSFLIAGSTTLGPGLKGYIFWGTYKINFISISPYLLLISLAGIWTTEQRSIKYESSFQTLFRVIWIYIGTVLLPSILILYAPSLVDSVLFFIGSMILLIVLRKNRIFLFTHLSLLAVSLCYFVLRASFHSYQIERILAFTKPNEDTLGLNYMVIQSKMAIHSAGWWGHGFGSPINTLPELHSEMMFSFLIYCFGWAAGICIFITVILFIQHALRITFKVQDHYGKALVSVLLTLFAIQYIWSMLMSLGLAPLSSFTLPFVSYRGSLVIFQFAAIGLMLSVYRRKDLGSWINTSEKK